MTFGIGVNIVFFALMGIVALVQPRFVISFVKLVPETPDARNEVRAVYGGFGIAVALLLWFGSDMPEFRSGILLAVAGALLGMAAGRIFSFLIERGGYWPVVFVFMEATLAALLLYSL